jgi:glutathione S-transferase
LHALIKLSVLNKGVPFFVRPITSFISSKVHQVLLDPEFALNLSFIEQQLKSSGGDYICGKDLAAADFLMAFSLDTCALEDVGKPLTKEKYPACVAYLERLKSREAWKRAVERIEEAKEEAKTQ